MSSAKTTVYSAGFETLAAAAGSPILELSSFLNPAPANPVELAVLSISLVLKSATASDIGLLFASGQGDPKTSFYGAAEGPVLTAVANANLGQCAIDWNTPPTINITPFVGNPYMAQVPAPAVAGAEISWKWSETSPLIITTDAAAPGFQSLLVWNYGAAAASILACKVRWAQPTIVSPYRQSYGA